MPIASRIIWVHFDWIYARPPALRFRISDDEEGKTEVGYGSCVKKCSYQDDTQRQGQEYGELQCEAYRLSAEPLLGVFQRRDD